MGGRKLKSSLFIQNDSVVIVDTSEIEELTLEEIEDEEDVPDLPEEMKPYCTGKQIYWAVEGHEEEEHNNGEGELATFDLRLSYSTASIILGLYRRSKIVNNYVSTYRETCCFTSVSIGAHTLFLKHISGTTCPIVFNVSTQHI